MSAALYLLAAHAAADFPLQSDRMAVEKLDDANVRALHVMHHVVTTSVAVEYAYGLDLQGFVFVGIVALAHYIIDSRRWTGSTEEFPTKHIWFDQVLHLISLAMAHAVVFG